MTLAAASSPPAQPHQGLCLQGITTMRLPWRLEVAAALQQAQQLPESLWRMHFNKGRHDGGWQALALRAAAQAPSDIMPMDAEVEAYADCEALQACPAIAELLKGLDLQWKSVRMMRLQPDSEIMEHRDAGLCAAEGDARLHIPLQTEEQVFFHLGGRRVHMRVGECWYTDVSLPHRVRNRSGKARIHLVADALVDERLAQAFAAGDQGEPAPKDGDPWLAFEQFRQQVFAEPALADALAGCPDLASLSARSIEMGQAQGLVFDASDVESAMQAGRRAWNAQWML
ncbi:aspartyl/asparaginyl beta-hydroxylase domain-containing protein [Comamonas sp. JUb58]|uniref:aspartyl/asparaginyl beta-hydroxylase domain-containing protein n=1 Tax=Comamonas sp. JUb58 TaxID=2485114 RepID=UPI001414EADC|nr:aspartyl/asparaginyl beta-hydroxylase domain-containing protein [Comamonas sp. JUb58]